MATGSLYTSIRDWQTRVLGIRQGIFDQPIQTDLHVVDLITSEGVVVHDSQERIQYTALSYCWGNSKFDCRVTCPEEGIGNIVTGFGRKSWHCYRPHPDQSIFTLFELSVQCHCTDMKDRIYGLLGMSMDVDLSTSDYLAAQKLLAIDYGRTVSQIFENVARYNILRSSSLEMLALSGTFGSICSEISLPSWVPDWRTKHDYARVWEWSHHRELRNEERDRILDSPEGQLNIQARRLGQVVTCVRPSHNDQEVLATFETVLDYLRSYYTPDDQGNLLCQQHDGTQGRNMPLWTRFMPKAMWWQLLSEIPRQWTLSDFVHDGDVLAIVKSCPGVVILRPDTHHPRYRYVGYVDFSQSFAGVSRESKQAMRLFLAEAQKYDDTFPSDFEDFTLV